jgi:hypothetical protein
VCTGLRDLTVIQNYALGELVYDHRNLPQAVAVISGAWLRRMWKEVAVA